MTAKRTRILSRSACLVLLTISILFPWPAWAAPFAVRIHRAQDGSAVLDWNSTTGLVYEVYWRSNLSQGTPWLLLSSLKATNSVTSLADQGASARIHPSADLSRFYRVREAFSTTLSNDFDDDTLLSLAGSPYYLTRSVRVPSGVRVTIEAGVSILCSDGVSLTVEGILVGAGLPANPITFTSDSAAGRPGDWVGLRFLDSSVDTACVLSNVVIEFARMGVFCQDASPRIVANHIRHASQHGIQLERSSPLIQECILERNEQDGILCTDQSSPVIFRSLIRGNGSDGVELTGSGSASNRNSRPLLLENEFDRNATYAVRATAPYRPAEMVVNARSNWWGTPDPALIAAAIYDYSDNPNGSPVVNVGNWLTSPGGVPSAGLYAGGVIGTDSVWRTTDTPIHVFGNVIVASNTTLSIDVGVEIRFYGPYRLDIFGTLRALGNPVQPILLTSGHVAPLRGDWEGIRFQDSSADHACVVSNAIVEFARTGIACFDSSPQLVASTLMDCSQHGISLERSSPLIQDCTIQDNVLDGIHCVDQSSPLILNNRIRVNGSDGVELTGSGSVSNRNSLPRLAGNTFEGNTTYALRTAAQYRPAEFIIDARSNWWGSAEAMLIAAAIYDYTDNANGSPIVNVGNWLGFVGGTPTGGLYANGPVGMDTTWRAADSPVHVFGHVVVGSNATLNIDAGVEVWFHGLYRLDVNGTLRALGTPALPVVFTGGDSFPLPGDWDGIRFLDSSADSACLLSNAIVEFARAGVTCQDASPRLIACEVAECSQNGLSLERSSPLLQECSFNYNGNDGVLCSDSSSPEILASRIFANGGDGVELSGASTVSNRNSRPIVRDTLIYGNSLMGVRALANFRPGEFEIDARNNWWGSSDPRVIATLVYDYTDNPNGSPVVNFGNWLLSTTGPAMPGRAVSGPLFGNVTWRAAESPIAFIGPVQVISNATLTIDAGVAATVYGNYRFDIAGALKVNGRSNAPVTFAPEPGFQNPGAWPGIRFTDTSVDADCVVSNAVVEFATIGFDVVDAAPQLIGCRASHSSSHGISLTRSSPLIESCSATENRSSGIYCNDRSSPFILNSLMATNGGDGLLCNDRSSPLVSGNLISSNASHGIELTGASTVTNRNSIPVINGNEVSGNRQFALRATGFFLPAETRVNARSNWWGTVDPLVIAQQIYDYNDDANQSPVIEYGNWVPLPGAAPLPGFFATGPILSNTIWQAIDSPVSVIGHLLVHSNASLAINAGVEVIFLGNYRLNVEGELRALGTLSQAVVFTSGRPLPAKSDWPGLNFTAASTNRACVLSNTVIEFADRGVHCLRTSPRIVSSQLRQNRIGASLDTSDAVLVGNLIEFNDTGLICGQFSRPLIEGNTVTLSRNNGIEVVSPGGSQAANPQPAILRNSLFGNGTAGGSLRYNLHASGFFQPASNIVSAAFNWWGTTDTNLINLAIFDRRDNTGAPVVTYDPFLAANTNFAVTGSAGSSFWISPNGDGVLDALTLNSALTHDGSWSVAILNDAGQIRRSMAGSGAALMTTWDGTDSSNQLVADGRYRPVVFATNGTDGQVTRAYTDAVRLDRLPPSANQMVPTLADGTVAHDLVVNGTASDSGLLLNYVIDYGPSPAPTSFSLLDSNNTPVVNGVLSRIDSRTLSNGAYTVRLRVSDYAGNVSVAQTIVQVENLHILNPAAANVFFDPAQSSAQISFGIDRDSDVLVTIVPVESTVSIQGDVTVNLLTNDPVQVFGGRLARGAHMFSWNGRDQFGILGTNRLYAFIIEAQSDQGRNDAYHPPYVTGPVTFTNFVANTNFNFFANEPSAITYSLYAPAFVMLAVQFRPYPVIFGEPRNAGPHTEYWYGRSLADNSLLVGEFTLALKTQVLPENVLVIDRPFAPALRDVQTESYVITPTYSEVSEVDYTLDRATIVTVSLRDPNGNLITLEDQVRRAAGTHKVEWDAHNAARQVINLEGDYEVIVTAYEQSVGRTETKSANLRVRR